MNELSKAAQILGRKGGKSGTGQSKARPSENCRLAAIKRWQSRKIPVEKRFWNKVQIREPNECWIYTGGKFTDGYGGFHYNGKTFKSHRFCWTLKNGTIPDGMCICHTCDNPICVNPNHLFLGTNQDNVDDKCRKGRTNSGRQINHPLKKLTDQTVREIRELYATGKFSQMQLAKQFSVSQALIMRVHLRRIWAHVI